MRTCGDLLAEADYWEEEARRRACINVLHHAVTYALTAIDEHLAGAEIDWQDVQGVLKRAIGEKAGQ